MRGRGALVVAQVALAVVMLTASSLAAKSVRAAFGRPLGLTIDRLVILGWSSTRRYIRIRPVPGLRPMPRARRSRQCPVSPGRRR
jgi:hypothetical protein